MRYADIYYDDVVNGIGIGAVLFVQYCPHHCRGCHNPQTWDKNGGFIFDKSTLNSLMKYFEDVPFADRLTLSGGDPLANLELTNYVVNEFKTKFPNKKIWIYTGYTYEELIKDKKYEEILKLTDVLVDGRFEIDKRDISLAFRGSSNQRVIDVQESLRQNKVVLFRSV